MILIHDSALPPTEKHVALALSTFGQARDGRIHSISAGVHRIGWMVGLHERSVQRSLERLRRRGVLAATAEWRGGRGDSGTPAVYTLDAGALPTRPPYSPPRKRTTPVSPFQPEKGDKRDAKKVTNGAEKDDTGVTRSKDLIQKSRSGDLCEGRDNQLVRRRAGARPPSSHTSCLRPCGKVCLPISLAHELAGRLGGDHAEALRAIDKWRREVLDMVGDRPVSEKSYTFWWAWFERSGVGSGLPDAVALSRSGNHGG